jgi:hypothetical protein
MLPFLPNHRIAYGGTNYSSANMLNTDSSLDSSVLFYPSSTRIERCGGCCSSDLLVCEPIQTEIVHFQALKTINLQNIIAAVIARLWSSLQAYVPNACRCECSKSTTVANANPTTKPGIILSRSNSSNSKRYWDSRNCICRCQDHGYNKQCSTGFYYKEDVYKDEFENELFKPKKTNYKAISLTGANHDGVSAGETLISTFSITKTDSRNWPLFLNRLTIISWLTADQR